MTTKSKLLTSDGGPHLLLPNSGREYWGKNHPVDVLTPGSDYQRACKIEPPFGFVDIGHTKGLVLAGNPMITTWGELPDKSGIDVCVFESWKSDNVDVLQTLALTAQSAANFSSMGLDWVIPEGGLTLMYSGDRPGHSEYGEVSVPLKAGTYQVLKGSFQNDLGKVMIARVREK
jgi:immunity protein 21 of polymorphic toxin system